MIRNAIFTIVATSSRSEAAARASILASAGQPALLAPAEVAAVALHLAGPHGSQTTGQAITIE